MRRTILAVGECFRSLQVELVVFSHSTLKQKKYAHSEQRSHPSPLRAESESGKTALCSA
jgi:hypothetical protein